MDWNFIIFSLVKIAIVVGVVQGMVAYAVLAERKISAWIQDRVGPNRTRRRSCKYSGARPAADALGISSRWRTA
jgi:NADH:ubiquinone oxidoreductase subunit H